MANLIRICQKIKNPAQLRDLFVTSAGFKLLYEFVLIKFKLIFKLLHIKTLYIKEY